MPRIFESIVLPTVFSIAWSKIVIERPLVVYYGMSHLSLVFSLRTLEPLGEGLYTALHTAVAPGVQAAVKT